MSNGRTLIKKSTKLTEKRLKSFDMERFAQDAKWIENSSVWKDIKTVWRTYRREWSEAEDKLEREVFKLRVGDELQPGIIKLAKVYVANKRRTCEEIGIISKAYDLPASTTMKELLKVIHELNNLAEVHGILCQFPLPGGMNEQEAVLAIDPAKDVDGLNPLNVGLLATGQPKFISCTPLGVLEILKRYEVETVGKQVVVLGRSNLVGRPLATLLSQKGWDATVTICHSRTRNLESHV